MRKVRIPQPYARELKKEIKKNQRNIETQDEDDKEDYWQDSDIELESDEE